MGNREKYPWERGRPARSFTWCSPLLSAKERAGRPRSQLMRCFNNIRHGIDRIAERAQHFRHPLLRHRRHYQRGRLRGTFEPGHLFLQLLRHQGVGLVEGNDLPLVSKTMAIGYQLVAHGFVSLAGMFAGAVDEMQEYAAALHMAKKTVAEPDALMGASDHTRDVPENEFATVDRDDADLRMQRGERGIGDIL